MKYTLQLSRRAEKDLDKLDSTVRVRIVKALKRLESDPRIGFSLLGPLTGKWKLRVGVYRVIYTIEDDKLMVFVITVAHRAFLSFPRRRESTRAGRKNVKLL